MFLVTAVNKPRKSLGRWLLVKPSNAIVSALMTAVESLLPSLAPRTVCMVLLKPKAWSLELGWGESRSDVYSLQANAVPSQCDPSISLFLCLSHLGTL